MSMGPATWFNAALDKIANGTINLETDTLKWVLCTSVQALSASFVGASGFGRYADLTAELATANGYTVGGASAPNPTLVRTANVVKFTFDPTSWTITADTTAKYAVLYSFTAANKDLIAFFDLSQEGGSLTFNSLLRITAPPDGLLDWITV